MSYARMDHADWMERNIQAMRSIAGKRDTKRNREIAARLPKGDLTDFHKRLCDVIGIAFGGIYNTPTNWDTCDWNHGSGVSLTTYSDLSTFDFNRLTMLVFLCHEARIRMSIEGAAPRMVRLSFWPRHATGNMATRHPNIDEAVAAFREYVPADHRLVYREPTPAPESDEAVAS